jgi:hypothetical protein
MDTEESYTNIRAGWHKKFYSSDIIEFYPYKDPQDAHLLQIKMLRKPV